MAENSQCANKISIPDASQSLIFFFVLTGIYAILQYSSSKIALNNQIIPKYNINFVWSIIYVLLLVLGNYFINLNITTSICGETQWTNTLLITLIPWVLIFGTICILLTIFPGWLSPFSNTIGYLITKMMGLDKLIDDILIPRAEMDSGESPAEQRGPQEIISYNLEQIYSDRSLLINEATLSNFDTFWNRLKTGKLLRTTASEKPGFPELRNQLYNFIIMKNIIAEILWYLLSGLLVTSVGYNYIVNSSCKRSINQLSATHKAYVQLQNQINETSDPSITYTAG